MAQAKQAFDVEVIQFVGERSAPVERIAAACGSGGSFMSQAIAIGCDTFVTGETNFHTALEAEATSTNLVLLGHFSSERFALEMLADELKIAFSGIEVWASEKESDPLNWM